MKGKPGKKRKVEQPKNGKKPVKGKERAFDRPIIPVPGTDNGDEEDEEELAEEDLAFFAENREGGFLASLDKKGILRCVFLDLYCSVTIVQRIVLLHQE